jgi:hypothetical protein
VLDLDDLDRRIHAAVDEINRRRAALPIPYAQIDLRAHNVNLAKLRGAEDSTIPI